MVTVVGKRRGEEVLARLLVYLALLKIAGNFRLDDLLRMGK